MKLVLFNNYRPGILRGDDVIDAGAAVAGLRQRHPQDTMLTVIEHWEQLRPAFERLAAGEGGVPRHTVRLRAPVPRPAKILGAYGNYKEGTGRDRLPLDFFLKSSDCVIGDGDTVLLPPMLATIFHHEAELGVVIGSRARDLPNSRAALDAVFGYTCFVDVSGRGLGRPGTIARMGKSVDTFGPMGPCIVTTDELPEPNRLSVRLWVNGQLRQDYTTEDMEYTVPEVVSYTSSIMTLLPGDLLACGTNHQGLGPLQDGDDVSMAIEGVGSFRFVVSDPLQRHWEPEVDQAMAAQMRAPGQPLH